MMCLSILPMERHIVWPGCCLYVMQLCLHSNARHSHMPSLWAGCPNIALPFTQQWHHLWWKAGQTCISVWLCEKILYSLQTSQSKAWSGQEALEKSNPSCQSDVQPGQQSCKKLDNIMWYVWGIPVTLICWGKHTCAHNAFLLTQWTQAWWGGAPHIHSKDTHWIERVCSTSTTDTKSSGGTGCHHYEMTLYAPSYLVYVLQYNHMHI